MKEEVKPLDNKLQQSGNDGTLEVKINEYTHPYLLKNPSKDYYFELSLGSAMTQTERGTIKLGGAGAAQVEGAKTIINIRDLRTLAVSDVTKDKFLVIKLMNSENQVIAKT